jgi:hypothetical protein
MTFFSQNGYFVEFRSLAVVRGGAGDAFAPPEFEVSEKRTEREMESPLQSAPPGLKT